MECARSPAKHHRHQTVRAIPDRGRLGVADQHFRWSELSSQRRSISAGPQSAGIQWIALAQHHARRPAIRTNTTTPRRAGRGPAPGARGRSRDDQDPVLRPSAPRVGSTWARTSGGTSWAGIADVAGGPVTGNKHARLVAECPQVPRRRQGVICQNPHISRKFKSSCVLLL